LAQLQLDSPPGKKPRSFRRSRFKPGAQVLRQHSWELVVDDITSNTEVRARNFLVVQVTFTHSILLKQIESTPSPFNQFGHKSHH
jgi:hypothetical protein